MLPSIRIALLVYGFILGGVAAQSGEFSFICPSSDGVFRNPDDCGSYYICEQGDPRMQFCSEGLHFNQLKRSCDWQGLAGCENGDPVASVSSFMSGTPSEDVQCQTQTCACVYPSQKRCDEYYICEKGIAYEERCSSGLLMNPGTLSCDYEENVECNLTSTADNAHDVSADTLIITDKDNMSTTDDLHTGKSIIEQFFNMTTSKAQNNQSAVENSTPKIFLDLDTGTDNLVSQSTYSRFQNFNLDLSNVKSATSKEENTEDNIATTFQTKVASLSETKLTPKELSDVPIISTEVNPTDEVLSDENYQSQRTTNVLNVSNSTWELIPHSVKDDDYSYSAIPADNTPVASVTSVKDSVDEITRTNIVVATTETRTNTENPSNEMSVAPSDEYPDHKVFTLSDFPQSQGTDYDIVIGPIELTSTKSSIACSCEHCVIPNYEDCAKYFACLNGTGYPATCPSGYLFDAAIGRCALGETVECNVSSRCLSPNGNFSDSNNCSYFIECKDSIGYRRYCPAPLHFSQQIGQCVDPCEAKCNRSLDCNETVTSVNSDEEFRVESQSDSGTPSTYPSENFFTREQNTSGISVNTVTPNDHVEVELINENGEKTADIYRETPNSVNTLSDPLIKKNSDESIHDADQNTALITFEGTYIPKSTQEFHSSSLSEVNSAEAVTIISKSFSYVSIPKTSGSYVQTNAISLSSASHEDNDILSGEETIEPFVGDVSKSSIVSENNGNQVIVVSFDGALSSPATAFITTRTPDITTEADNGTDDISIKNEFQSTAESVENNFTTLFSARSKEITQGITIDETVSAFTDNISISKSAVTTPVWRTDKTNVGTEQNTGEFTIPTVVARPADNEHDSDKISVSLNSDDVGFSSTVLPTRISPKGDTILTTPQNDGASYIFVASESEKTNTEIGDHGIDEHSESVISSKDQLTTFDDEESSNGNFMRESVGIETSTVSEVSSSTPNLITHHEESDEAQTADDTLGIATDITSSHKVSDLVVTTFQSSMGTSDGEISAARTFIQTNETSETHISNTVDGTAVSVKDMTSTNFWNDSSSVSTKRMETTFSNSSVLTEDSTTSFAWTPSGEYTDANKDTKFVSGSDNQFEKFLNASDKITQSQPTTLIENTVPSSSSMINKETGDNIDLESTVSTDESTYSNKDTEFVSKNDNHSTFSVADDGTTDNIKKESVKVFTKSKELTFSTQVNDEITAGLVTNPESTDKTSAGLGGLSEFTNTPSWKEPSENIEATTDNNKTTHIAVPDFSTNISVIETSQAMTGTAIDVSDSDIANTSHFSTMSTIIDHDTFKPGDERTRTITDFSGLSTTSVDISQSSQFPKRDDGITEIVEGHESVKETGSEFEVLATRTSQTSDVTKVDEVTEENNQTTGKYSTESSGATKTESTEITDGKDTSYATSSQSISTINYTSEISEMGTSDLKTRDFNESSQRSTIPFVASSGTSNNVDNETTHSSTNLSEATYFTTFTDFSAKPSETFTDNVTTSSTTEAVSSTATETHGESNGATSAVDNGGVTVSSGADDSAFTTNDTPQTTRNDTPQTTRNDINPTAASGSSSDFATDGDFVVNINISDDANTGSNEINGNRGTALPFFSTVTARVSTDGQIIRTIKGADQEASSTTQETLSRSDNSEATNDTAAVVNDGRTVSFVPDESFSTDIPRSTSINAETASQILENTSTPSNSSSKITSEDFTSGDNEGDANGSTIIGSTEGNVNATDASNISSTLSVSSSDSEIIHTEIINKQTSFITMVTTESPDTTGWHTAETHSDIHDDVSVTTGSFISIDDETLSTKSHESTFTITETPQKSTVRVTSQISEHTSSDGSIVISDETGKITNDYATKISTASANSNITLSTTETDDEIASQSVSANSEFVTSNSFTTNGVIATTFRQDETDNDLVNKTTGSHSLEVASTSTNTISATVVATFGGNTTGSSIPSERFHPSTSTETEHTTVSNVNTEIVTPGIINEETNNIKDIVFNTTIYLPATLFTSREVTIDTTTRTKTSGSSESDFTTASPGFSESDFTTAPPGSSESDFATAEFITHNQTRQFSLDDFNFSSSSGTLSTTYEPQTGITETRITTRISQPISPASSSTRSTNFDITDSVYSTVISTDNASYDTDSVHEMSNKPPTEPVATSSGSVKSTAIPVTDGSSLTVHTIVQSEGSGSPQVYSKTTGSLIPTTEPSQLCQEQGLFHVDGDCSKFINCTSDVPSIGRCPDGLHFNSTTRTCDWKENVRCGEKPQPLKKPQTGLYCTCQFCLLASNTDCSEYYMCLEGGSYAFKCSKGLLFNNTAKMCDYAEQVRCATEVNQVTPEPITFNITPSKGHKVCEQGNGLFKNDQDCGSFIHCSNWIPYVMNCPAHLHFSERTKRCEYPCEADCDKALVCPSTKPEETLQDPACSCYNCVVPVKGTCSYYIECRHGKAQKRKCPRGQLFDEGQKKCNWAHKVPCPHGTICPELNGVFEYKEDCRKFLHCSNGIPHIKQCPGKLEFNPQQERCGWPAGRCVSQKQNIVADDNTQDLPKALSCPKSDGLFPSPRNCSEFIHCAHNIPYVKICHPPLLFNSKLMVCDWPRNVDCSVQHAAPSRCRRENHYRFRCPRSGGFIPDAANCTVFHDCSTGKACLRSCPDGLLFDETKGACDIPERTNCKMQETPELEHSCDNKFGLIADPNNPKCFYRCIKGSRVRGCCSRNRFFDKNVRHCTYKDKYRSRG